MNHCSYRGHELIERETQADPAVVELVCIHCDHYVVVEAAKVER